MRCALTAVVYLAFWGVCAADEKPRNEAELIFPLSQKHNHAPGVVECANGDLLVSWYRGSGERSADDVAVYGARRRKGSPTWSEAFLMADYPGFPDCNTAMMIDLKGKLWLFWPTVLAGEWDSVLTNALISTNYLADGPPKWDRHTVILLKPDDFQKEFLEYLDNNLGNKRPLSEKQQGFLQKARDLSGDKLFHRISWQPRCKPTVLPSGRILFPLYSDTYSISIMAVSDDGGLSWYASKPLIGYGNIQPTVLRRNNGTLVAYMRENGFQECIRYCESSDDGITWSKIANSDLPNPGGGIDGVRLANGHWLLVYNDTVSGRHQLAVSISQDEGKTWTSTRHLEKSDRSEGRSYAYPAVIQGADGMLHCVYRYAERAGVSMKHAAFNEAWVKAK
ncbi:MAG: exo-alpha-sialidase [Planctomycetaceae bacterium]